MGYNTLKYGKIRKFLDFFPIFLNYDIYDVIIRHD